MVKIKEKIVSDIQNYFNNNRKKAIIAVYLFGSHANGKATAMSDIDIAVLLNESVSQVDYLNTKLLLLAELSSCLNEERIDVVILNEIFYDLAYNVIKDGELLFERQDTRGQLVEFKARTFDRYFDYLPVKKMFSEALSMRIREGRFGG